MRQPEFPFAKYRKWGETPENKPDIDTDAILSLADWQAKTFKRPIRDDLTGYYSFHPSLNGATGYVNRAHARLFAGKTAISEGLSEEVFSGNKLRQPKHIAENAESAIAVFWAISQTRRDVLAQTLANVSDGKEVPHTQAMWAANAVADYGHCLQYPVDIDHAGKNHGSELAIVIKRIGGSAASDLENFGLFAEVEPGSLESYDGIVAMEASIAEQERRCDFWSPRHQAILDAFPGVRPSNEVLYMRLSLSELLSIDFIEIA